LGQPFLGGRMVGWVNVFRPIFIWDNSYHFSNKKLGIVFGKLQFCDVIGLFFYIWKNHQIIYITKLKKKQKKKKKKNQCLGILGAFPKFVKGNAWPIIPPSNLEEWFTQVTPKNAFFYWLGNKCFPTI
jgi:hypothetical protein